MGYIKLLYFVFIFTTWFRSALYMYEAFLEIKAKYGLTYSDYIFMSLSKKKLLYSETPKAKLNKDISDRNGMYFIAGLLIAMIFQFN